MKEEIRKFALDLGVDDVGFADPADYVSPKSFPLETFLSPTKSVIVLIFKELSSCESPSMSAAMNGRMDVMSFERSCSYRLARFLEKEFKARIASMPYSYPMEISKTRPALADFSQRHAAVAAGLGTFGRHNLVIHPEFGTRIAISSILTDLETPSDPRLEEDLCTQCGQCVVNCPSGALDIEGQTNVGKCLKQSQPYGLGASVAFWTRLLNQPPDAQKEMFKDDHYWRLYQAGYIGIQYFCFNCMKSCPIGQ